MLSFRFKKAFFIVTFLAILSLGITSAWSQATSGNVAGSIVDRSGAAIPNASVSATNVATGVVSTVKANSVGDFLLPNLPPGQYNITGSATGFANFTLKNFLVELNKTSTARLALPVAVTNTVVEVSAEAGITIDTTTAQLQTSFESEEVKTLPTSSSSNGVLNLSLLVPGVATGGGMGVGTGPSVGGLRPENNNYTIEGIDNNDKGVTGPLVSIPNDAVGEFTAITNQFSPDFGHSAGGQFNTTVKSGTNHIHGLAYEYFENRNLNAENAVAGQKQPNPRYDNNRFGGQAGGPVIKDKLFWFGNYEYQAIGQSGQATICTPTAAGIAKLKGMTQLNQTNLGIYTKYMPVSPSQIDATADAACGNQTSGLQSLTVFTDGQWNAATQGYGVGGAQDIPLGNYIIAAPNYNNYKTLVTSTDWSISPTDNFRGRYIYNNDPGIDTAASLPAFFLPIPTIYHLIALSEYHNWTPNLINEARVGFNRYYNITPAGNFAFSGLDSFPNLTFVDQGQINLGPNSNAPQSTVQNLYQFTDNLSWVKGKHSLKFGFDGRKYIAPQTFTQRVRGDYEWNYLSEYLNDVAPTYFGERSTGNFIYYGDETGLYGYANDTWRVSEKLSLNYGLRYEFNAVPVGERMQSLNSAASVAGLVTFASPQPQKHNFFPRVGINYAVNPNTSIRLGFGTAGDILDDNLGLLSFPPQYSSTTDVDTTISKQPTAAQCTGTGTAVGTYTEGCPNFLKNGGLLRGTGTLNTYPTLAAQRAATSAYLPIQQIAPYAETWSLGVQHVFKNIYTAEVRYVGTRGIHLPTQDQINVQPEVTPANQLPTLMSAPAAATLGTYTNTLAAIQAAPTKYFVPAWYNAGFTGKVTSYRPLSESNYNGLETSLRRQFTNGLLLNAAWTWSKAMDDATAATFSTTLTPRRPQNSQNVAADYSRSALSRTHRVTVYAVYDLPFFKTSSWLLKNTVGNWEISPMYIYESPEYVTVLSGVNSNLNGEGGGIDRTIYNVKGVKHTGSDVTAYANPNLASLCTNTAKDPNGTIICSADTVAYVANNPNAEYIRAQIGTLPTSQRNTEPLNPINNFDATAIKRFSFGESRSIEFSAQAYNVLNHAQYVAGSIDNVDNNYHYNTLNTAYQTASSPLFTKWNKEFTANARTMQLSLKFNF